MKKKFLVFLCVMSVLMCAVFSMMAMAADPIVGFAHIDKYTYEIMNPEQFDTTLNLTCGSSTYIALLLKNSEEAFNPSLVSAEGGITLTQVGTEVGNNLYQVRANDFGAAAITYGNLSIPVNVDLPAVGVYKAAAATEENFITEFTITEENNKFYIINRYSNFTITSIVGRDKATQDITTSITKSATDNNVYEVVVDGVVNDVVYMANYEISCSDGGFYNAPVRILSAKPYLTYCNLNGDGQGGFILPANPTYSNSLRLSLGSNSRIALVVQNNAAVFDPQKVSIEGDCISLTPIENDEYDNFYTVTATAFGSATIKYGELSIPVSVELPYFGAYSAASATEDNYLTQFNITDENNKFYIINREPSFTITSITGRDAATQAIIESITKSEADDNVYEIVVTGACQNARFDVSYTRSGNSSVRTNTVFLNIADTRPYLAFYQLNFNNGDYIIPNNPSYRTSMTNSPGGYVGIALVMQNSNEAFDPAKVKVEGDCITLKPMTDQVPNNWFVVEKNALGTAVIKYGDYSIPVTLSLPQLGIFKTQSYSEDAYISEWHYSDKYENVFYFMNQAGFTAEEAATLTVALNNGGDASSYVDYEIVERGSTGKYDVRFTVQHNRALLKNSVYLRVNITINGRNNSSSIAIDKERGFNSVVNIDGVDYTVFFGIYDTNGEYLNSFGDYMTLGNGQTTAPAEEENFSHSVTDTHGEIAVYVGTPIAESSSTNPAMLENEEITDSIVIDKLYIEHKIGEKAFSLTRPNYSDELVSTQENLLPNQLQFYHSDINCGYAVLKCDLTITYGGRNIKTTVAMHMFNYKYDRVTEIRPSADTVEALNEYLADLVANIQPDTVYRIVVPADIVYEGTIIVPEFDPNLINTSIHINAENNGQAGRPQIIGGINIAGKARLNSLSNVDFVAPEAPNIGEITSAITGSCSQIDGCTFRGYDVAIDNTDDILGSLHSNVFLDNDIAIRIDQQASGGINLNGNSNNRFMRNGIAIQVLNLTQFVGAFYFRVYDSDFIDNDVDFDFAEEGTYYFYRNYYGEKKDKDYGPNYGANYSDFWDNDLDNDGREDSSGTRRAPIIEEHENVTIITNPRRTNSILSENDTLGFDIDGKIYILDEMTGELVIAKKELKDQDNNVKIKVGKDDGSGNHNWDDEPWWEFKKK